MQFGLFPHIILHCRGHNWLKGTCSFSPWISSAVRPLKLMLHHLPNLKCVFLWFCVHFHRIIYYLIVPNYATMWWESFDFVFVFVLDRFLEMKILLFWFLLPQRHLMLVKLYPSCMSLSWVHSQVCIFLPHSHLSLVPLFYGQYGFYTNLSCNANLVVLSWVLKFNISDKSEI